MKSPLTIIKKIVYFKVTFYKLEFKMSYTEQKKLLEELKKYERKMSAPDLESYKMFIKRDKDDEDFDTVSMKKLRELVDKYHIPVDKSKFDSFFKKP